MNARNRRTLWIVVLVLFALVSVIRLVRTVQRDGLGDSTLWIALVVVLLICAVTVAVMLGRSRRVVANARQDRSDVVVIPAYSTGEAVEEAASYTVAAPPGLMGTGGSPMALVVTDHHVEVWAGRHSTAPSWTVSRPAGATVVRAVYGTRTVEALNVSDGRTSVTVVPAYNPLRAMGGSGRADLERAVAEAGGDRRG